MEDSVSTFQSEECANFVDWYKLPDEIWLHIFSYLHQHTILSAVRHVCCLFNSLAFDSSLWREINMKTWHGNPAVLEALYELLQPEIDRVSQHLRSFSFCQITGNRVFGSVKRLLFYKFSNIVNLELTGCDCVTAQILDEIKLSCKKIESLELHGCSNVDDEAMKVVSKFEHLSKLDISHCTQVTEEGVNFIADMPCQILHFLSNVEFHLDDRCVENLVSKQTKIEFLVIHGLGLSDNSVIAVCRYLGNLQRFRICNCTNLSDTSFRALYGKVSLQQLHLENIPDNISAPAIAGLFKDKLFVNLRDLAICDTKAVDDNTINVIVSGCPQLEIASFDHCSSVTDTSITNLMESCKQLQLLSLRGLTKLRGDRFEEINQYLPELTYLNISLCSSISEQKKFQLLSLHPKLIVVIDVE
ncbi:unnamed protein product [Clavelina lepadiformis]|uniref:F-box domain-containing protein n=1 Tax=Clavelina lepadiformis TaxID=159417 RepID=A0ABP0FET0_CLALP